jgi:WhiB family transcriptional regulator, redox-sensing transcriptional regulator
VVLAELANRPAWQRQAACRQVGIEIFFAERGRSTGPATAICDTCSVREECLGTALADPATQGIWSGLSQRGRRGSAVA